VALGAGSRCAQLGGERGGALGSLRLASSACSAETVIFESAALSGRTEVDFAEADDLTDAIESFLEAARFGAGAGEGLLSFSIDASAFGAVLFLERLRPFFATGSDGSAGSGSKTDISMSSSVF